MGDQSAFLCGLDAFSKFLQQFKEFLLFFVVLRVHEDSGGFPLLGNDNRSLGHSHLSQNLGGVITKVSDWPHILSRFKSHIKYLLKYVRRYAYMFDLRCQEKGNVVTQRKVRVKEGPRVPRAISATGPPIRRSQPSSKKGRIASPLSFARAQTQVLC